MMMMTTTTSSSDESTLFPAWFNRVFALLQRSAKLWLALWALALLWGALTAKNFIKDAEDAAPEPRKGSRTHTDLMAFREFFPELANQEVLIVYTQCAHPGDAQCTVVCPATKCGKNCRGEHEDLRRAFQAITQQVLSLGGITSSMGYYNFSRTELDGAKCTFASGDGRATFATFAFSKETHGPQRHLVINTLRREIIPQNNPHPERYLISITGFDAMAMDGSNDAIDQIVMIDLFTMPVAFGLLGYMVRSFRLLLIALMNTAITFAFTFAFLAFLCDMTDTHPLTTTSSLVEVIGLAMSIDYSLFLLRRFADEIKNKRSAEYATKVALMNAGHVVMLSSLTFACVFLGFVVLPSQDLRSLGTACVVTVLTALVVCMTNTIALLNTFPDFFVGETSYADCFLRCRRNVKPRKLAAGETAVTATTASSASIAAVEPLLNGTADTASEDDDIRDGDEGLGRTVTGRMRHRRGARYRGCYFQFLKIATKWPYNFIIVACVYGLALPVALKVLDLKHNQDVKTAIPHSAPSAKTFENMSLAFPGGSMSPFFIVIQQHHKQAWNASYQEDEHDRASSRMFLAAQKLVHAMAEVIDDPQAVFVSPATLQGRDISFSMSKMLRNPKSLLCRADPDACTQYQYMYDRFTNGRRALLMQVTISRDPYGQAGVDFINRVHDVFHAFEGGNEEDGLSYHLCGDEVLLWADEEIAFSSLPLLIGVTLFIIFALLGLGFKTVMTPVRLSLTVVLPLAFVFGLAVLVYQEGILDWTGIRGLQSSKEGFYWYVPLVSFMQSLGLTIDYDVFCVSRALEHRADGYDIRAAIVKAVWEVNSTITVAGLIMAAAFGGLFLGNSQTINQFGFLLCTTVLVDTFIVQTLLVPSIISFGDTFSWFPRKMPMDGLITLDDAEFEDEQQ